ncbi:MAG TPA: DUF4198 domain-containing protein [Cellvibrio sp.]|nr:DUF4198 domain-containing protein [Cellvibrio sp.]
MNKKIAAKKLLSALALSCLAGFSLTAQAHRMWILPYETVAAGESTWITFDVAVSNDIFQIDHAGPRVDGITVLTPDGKAEEPKNLVAGQLRSSFDVNLTAQGTYKVAIVSGGLNARWETADGKRGSWPARGAKANPAEFATAVPKDAKNVEVSQNSRRVETFVTLGAPTQQALQPTNQGLELLPITHPNDLRIDEPSQFKFLIDGKPAAGVKVTIIPGGSRYRNSAQELEIESDSQGIIRIQWQGPGQYWLGASYKDDKAQKPAKNRVGSYSATFEVLPL